MDGMPSLTERSMTPLIMGPWSKALQNLDPHDRQYFLVSQSDPQKFLASLLKDVQAKRDAAHAKRWKFTKSDGSTIILRDVLEKIVNSISKYASIVDVAVSTAPMYAAPPWAVIRFLLQMSTSDLGAFGYMSEGIEHVADVMARYEIIENLYWCPTSVSSSRESKLLNENVIKVYTIILHYLAKARKFWLEHTAKRMAKALFTNMEAEHNALQSAIRKADDETNRIATLLQNQQSADDSKAIRETLDRLREETMVPMVRMAQNISDINDRLDRSQRKEVLHWLSTVPCELQHQEAARKIVKGTGRWLLDRPELLDWQMSSTSAIFWLHGIPGAGKSKLTTIFIESLLEQHRKASTPPPPLAYFYCSRRGADTRSRSSLEILSALLRQLTGRDTQLPLRGTVALEFQRRKELYGGTGAQISRLNTEDVVTHILAIAADDPIIIVVDALDEADEAERGDLFRSLEKILQESQNVVKIFVSSRNDGDIVDALEHYSNTNIEEGMNGEDIRKFAEYKVQEAIESKRLLRGRVSLSLRKEITETLLKGAQGMFRWVELSIETLSNSRRMAVEKDVRSQLGKLPAELKEQYKIIYRDILESAQSTSSIARKTFSWILAAQRILTVEEMIAAVALDDDGFYHTDLDIPRLLDICRNLVVVTSVNYTSKQMAFQMVHLSVREFLEQLPEFSAEQVHTVAVSRLLNDFNPSLRLAKNVPMREKSLQALRDYTIYLFEHAEMSLLATPECDLAPKMSSFLFDSRYNPTAMLNEWYHGIDEFYERSILPQDFPDLPLYQKRRNTLLKAGGLDLVCVNGLLSILQVLGNDKRIPWEAHSSEQLGRALYMATSHGKFAVAKWLLERQIVHPDEAHSHVPALYTAVWDQHEETVGLLLEYGADPLSGRERGFLNTPWNRVFNLPLSRRREFSNYNYAIFIRIYNSIESLYKDDGKLFLGFDWQHESLFEALRANWDEASQFLIGRGANDRLQTSQSAEEFVDIDERQSSTLQIAVKYSGFLVIEALLDRSLERSSNPATQSIISLQLESREHLAYINFLDNHGRSALHYLMDRQSSGIAEGEEIMRLLLKHGADPTAVSDEELTALHIAAAIGSTNMIRELVEEGLDLEAQDIYGATTLHIASGGAHRTPQVIRYLTDSGQEPLVRDSNGRTPLHYAAHSCNLPALEALLEVLLGRDGLSLSGAKRVATTHNLSGSADMGFGPYRKLVEYVNVADDEGNSPLHVVGTTRGLSQYEDANENKQIILEIKDTVRLLVDLGANLNSTAGGKTPLLSLMALSRHHQAGGEIAANELLNQGADPNIPDSKGATALHHRTRYWDEEPIEDLLNAGADIEAKDHDLCTPLHWACRDREPQTVRRLLLRDANCGARDRTGATPLHCAANARYQTVEAVAMLIKKGADVQSADYSGATPLHLAAQAGKLRRVRLLIRYNANPEAVDMDEKTAMHYAAEQASIINENENEDEDYEDIRPKHIATWLSLYKCSEKWCQQNMTRPKTLFKRTRSQILRTDRSWGDFNQIKSEVLTRS